jgi:hypothetical protein
MLSRSLLLLLIRFTPDNDGKSGLPQKTMSALPPKADVCSAQAHVCFGSQADICAATSDVRFTPDSDHESRHAQTVMSALPPKADVCGAFIYVCFGLRADMTRGRNRKC